MIVFQFILGLIKMMVISFLFLPCLFIDLCLNLGGMQYYSDGFMCHYLFMVLGIG